MNSEITIRVQFLNHIPEAEVGKIHEVADQMLCDFCEEMTENFLVYGKYMLGEDESLTVVQVEGHLFMRVQRKSLVLYIPDECLDVDVMIALMNNDVDRLNI